MTNSRAPKSATHTLAARPGPQSRTSAAFSNLELDEHDACAIIASVRKTGEATHGNLKRTLEALSKMGHRSGDVNGEGDGCGVLTDIPRRLWSEAMEQVGKPAWLAEDRRFFVGHLMIPAPQREKAWELQEGALKLIAESGVDLLVERPGQTRRLALGRLAREQEPVFWQIAGVVSNCPLEEVERDLFELALAIERTTGIHVASLSSHSVIYKVRGSVETLYHYYPELRSPDYTSAITLGHARYSTNTATIFERVQPFSLLGHNGEINTIARLREQAVMLGAQLVTSGSDSQDLDRAIATLIHLYGFTLTEALEMVFPPILSEVDKLPAGLQAVYRYYRQAFGPFAQGPAAIVARYGDECTFSVDALGLRPLWFGETEKEYFFSSEKGVVPMDLLCGDPRPLSPGEKMSLRLHRNQDAQVLDYPAVQQRLLKLARRRFGSFEQIEAALEPPEPKRRRVRAEGERESKILQSLCLPSYHASGLDRWLTAFGWGRDDREWVQALAQTGHEPIGSLGYDGPLAALTPERESMGLPGRNVADYFKEAVAVVTNPAIDREREIEHFSTQCIIGPRPNLSPDGLLTPGRLALDCPIILGGHPNEPLMPEALYHDVAAKVAAMRLEDIVASFGETAVAGLATVTQPGESTFDALDRLSQAAVEAVSSGAELVLLDDGPALAEGRGWIDPHLAIAAVDKALRTADWQHSNLRRQTGLILRAGAIRNLHDLIMALALGADAVAPYMLLEVAVDPGRQLILTDRATRLVNTVDALRVGLEKVTSTMGIHELRGYGRLFASIGLSQPVAEVMGMVNYAGSEQRGLTWHELDTNVLARVAVIGGAEEPRLAREQRFYPRVWKVAGQVGRGETEGADFEERAESLAEVQTVALRHVLEFRFPEQEPSLAASEVDIGLTGHDLPFVIASMSFGSQGEIAFRAYAEAAYRLNMIALNGERGEIRDLMGKYHFNRGQQIASGRFGVDADLINSSNLLEIKIGQGAKPGEGGHLPGRKVSPKVAAARHAQPGVDLISPSNNHDIYSIEDLAQFIEELKTANPKARVAVKVPVVPGIGIIAVGIAKAGADIVNLTGYDGGTGAARQHAIKHVGLPAEIGVVEAHHALTQAGLRHRVELWCDGGMRTAADVVKMMCLGANRVGFGTLAMVAIGCTICRSCQTDTCHQGIATQIESMVEAEGRGLRHFAPRDFDLAVQGLVNLFGALGKGVRQITARLGFERAQDLVGRADLLVQASHHARLDLSGLLALATPYAVAEVARPQHLGQRPLRRPRNHLTTVISNLVMETAVAGEEVISFEDDKVTPVDRALGTHLAGALTRYRHQWMWLPGHGGVGGSPESWRQPVSGGNGDGNHVREANLRFYASSVPGNGLGAYTTHPVNIVVEGGAQDGVAKGMHGGRVVILKGYNHDGVPVDGAVGKSLAYGAIEGLIIVQGNADSRACIRLSGADVVIGGEIRQPINDSLGLVGARANVKGFLCEYMTAGRVLVLGDPGPWICAGMTGGILYLRLQPQMNFDRDAIRRRIARGARVALGDVDESDEANLHNLLTAYADELASSHQPHEADRILDLLQDWRRHFVKLVPTRQQVNQGVSLE
ncbi:MAG: alpha-hydroxy-acid oxidizing protein [Anaerolineales bacterium]|nr:MAG: alpha-hydroxy-acid oxidizing protein [Anaerolineales bacterium]